MNASTTQLDTIRRLRAVLFVDVVDSVRIMSADETGTVTRWMTLMNEVAQHDLPLYRGRRVKLQGDGMLVEFESSGAAVACALAIQERTHGSEAAIDRAQRIRLRMGVHVAEVITDEFDIYGGGVNLAARLRDLAGPEEIVVSAAVRDHLIDGVDVSFEDLGDRQLKGFDRPVRAFRAWPPGPMPNIAMDRRRRSGDRPAIAVLPFRNLSGNPRHDFVGDLIAEDVISDMSRLTDLYVISRLSTAPFRDRLYQTRNIAEMLGARYVLTGSVLSDDTRLRLTAELTEMDATHVLWSDRFEGALADVFGLRDRLSSEIATRAVPFLRQLELQRARSRRPEDLTAYELTLRAIDLMHGRSREDLDRAQALFTQAMTTDPHYATPRVWLARSHVLRVGQGWSDDPRTDTRDALRHAEEALALDGNDAYAIAVWGFVSAYLEKDLDVALARYDLALQVNPSAVWAWAWSASANAWQGNGEKAVTLIQRAIDLSPFDPHMYNFAAIACGAHAVAGEFDAAIRWGQRSLRENRLFTAAHKNLIISLALSGRVEQARVAAAELLTMEPSFTVAGFRSRHPGSGSPHIERFCEGLLLAGIPR